MVDQVKATVMGHCPAVKERACPARSARTPSRVRKEKKRGTAFIKFIRHHAYRPPWPLQTGAARRQGNPSCHPAPKTSPSAWDSQDTHQPSSRCSK